MKIILIQKDGMVDISEKQKQILIEENISIEIHDYDVSDPSHITIDKNKTEYYLRELP
jgi:hypothetical protein